MSSLITSGGNIYLDIQGYDDSDECDDRDGSDDPLIDCVVIFLYFL